MSDREWVLEFVRKHSLAVEATTRADGAPQAAVIGVAITDELELVFDTLATSRKCANLRRDARIALVFGWDLDEACTLQLEGVADEPGGDDRRRVQAVYLESFPDGYERARDPAITYFRVRLSWARMSDFRTDPPTVTELALADGEAA